MPKPHLRIGLLCETGLRQKSFGQALVAAGHTLPLHIDYIDFLDTPEKLDDILNQVDVLRVDSPGGGYPVWSRFAKQSNFDTDGFSDRHGQIYPLYPYYQGMVFAINQAEQMARRREVKCTIDPQAVQVFMDKAACNTMCEKSGLPVPLELDGIGSFQDLNTAMQNANFRKVFMKPCHGSSASGVIAIEMFGNKVRARTTVELVQEDGKTLLYNSLKPRTYLDEEATRLIDHIARLGVIVEKWIPKFRLDARRCDVRLLVIDGKPAHIVARTSNTPITNLHLGNERGSANKLRAAIPSTTWNKIMLLGEKAGALYPDHICIGLDIAIHKNATDIYVLEINAFGDQLHDVIFDGHSPYAFQIKYLENWLATKQGYAA